MKTVVGTALIIGARKFLFSQAAQTSNRLWWWEAAPGEGREIVPQGLKFVFVRHGLARKDQAKVVVKGTGAELVEFLDDRDIFPYLAEMLGIEPDRGKEVATRQTDADQADAMPAAEDMRLKHDRVIDIPTSRIRPNPNQPRTHFNAGRLRALAQSIQKAGQKVPIIVVELKGDKEHDYEIYDGERRWRAAQIIHRPTLRAIVADSTSEAAMFKGSAVCNLGREDLQPMEMALAIKRVKDAEHLTLDALADMFGYSVAWITQHLALLKLTQSVQARVNPDLAEEAQLSVSTALEIAKLPLERQEDAAQHILKKRLSIFKTRYYIRHLALKFGVSSSHHRRGPDDDYRVLDQFIERTQTRADELLDLPGRTLRDVFTYRTPQEVKATIDRIGEVIKRLSAMQAAIKGKKSAEAA